MRSLTSDRMLRRPVCGAFHRQSRADRELTRSCSSADRSCSWRHSQCLSQPERRIWMVLSRHQRNQRAEMPDISRAPETVPRRKRRWNGDGGQRMGNCYDDDTEMALVNLNARHSCRDDFDIGMTPTSPDGSSTRSHRQRC